MYCRARSSEASARTFVERVRWHAACGAELFRRAREGDWVYRWWTGKRSWGRLEGPYVVVQPVDLGARFRFKERRYRPALYRPRGMDRKIDIPLDRGGVRLLSRFVGDSRKPEEVRTDPLAGEPRLLSEVQRRRLERVLAQLERKKR